MLIHTERGRILADGGEEVTRWRWLRKQFELPVGCISTPAQLWLLLSPPRDGMHDTALEVWMNGHQVATLQAQARQPRQWAWYQVNLPIGMLRYRTNELQLRAQQPAMSGWAIALEPGHVQPQSWLSLDRGVSWRQNMGISLALRGEYVARLRLPAHPTHSPPAVVYEDARHPRVQELASLIPPDVANESDAWLQILKLRTWIAGLWLHRPTGLIYTPWDPWTILDWTAHGSRTDPQPIAMCVHFGALMVSLTSALGHKARCVVTTGAVNSLEGHFLCEVWDEEHRQWVLHDSNVDMHYADGRRPLSLIDVVDRVWAGTDLHNLARVGEATSRQPPHVAGFVRQNLLPGTSYRMAGVWLNNHYVSDPTQAPPHHGRISYSETDILWYTPHDSTREQLAMFPFHARDRDVFLAEA